VSTLIKV